MAKSTSLKLDKATYLNGSKLREQFYYSRSISATLIVIHDGVNPPRRVAVITQRVHPMSRAPTPADSLSLNRESQEPLHIQYSPTRQSDLFSIPNLVLHGTEATGKSLTINVLLSAIDSPSTVIRSKECITTRHLLERTLTKVQEALGDTSPSVDGRCESISTFVAQLQRLLEDQKKFILVFDNIDRQREAAPTLLPALARLGELVCIRQLSSKGY